MYSSMQSGSSRPRKIRRTKEILKIQQENVEIHRVAVYSKEKLALNTLSDDGRLGTLSDMEYADRKDYYTEFCVRFISE